MSALNVDPDEFIKAWRTCQERHIASLFVVFCLFRFVSVGLCCWLCFVLLFLCVVVVVVVVVGVGLCV